MKYIGKLDKNKLGEYANKITTEEVILTDERIKHIQERHPGDYERYAKYINDVLLNPDYVLEDTKNIDTAIMLKRIQEETKNIQIVIKLSTGKDKKRDKNSILTLWKVRNSTYKQLIKNKKILYKNE